MRRKAEGLLEGAAEVVGAQARELRESRKRYLLRQMLLDVRADDALLPGGQPALGVRSAPIGTPCGSRGSCASTAQRVEIGSGGAPAFHQSLELEHRAPQHLILEEHPRGGAELLSRHGLCFRSGGIVPRSVEIEEHDARRRPRAMPLEIAVTGGDEGRAYAPNRAGSISARPL